MIIINDTLISAEIFTEYFKCDINNCRGACCVEGDEGAPLTKEECKILEKSYKVFKGFMRNEGREAVNKQGKYCINEEGEITTPLINKKECAYVFFDENNIAKCAIEHAFNEGLTDFRKPVSCHLYPVRIAEYSNYEGVNYHRWQICNCAITKGESDKTRIYEFLKEALIRKYGEDWYLQLDEYVKSQIGK